MSKYHSFFNFLENELPKGTHVIFIGLGNINRADDGFGIFLARKLKSIFPKSTFNELDDDIDDLFLRLINNVISVDVIIYLDAVDVNKAPGEIAFVNLDNVKLTRAISTHESTLPIYFSLIKKRGISQYLLGVQPENLGQNNYISRVVSAKIDYISKKINKLLTIKISEV